MNEYMYVIHVLIDVVKVIMWLAAYRFMDGVLTVMCRLLRLLFRGNIGFSFGLDESISVIMVLIPIAIPFWLFCRW